MKTNLQIHKKISILLIMCAIPAIMARGARAQENLSESEIHTLAKASQNPVANMISVPFQYNANFNVGPHDRVQSTLNFQPVAPVKLNDDWNVILRTIVPLMDQPDLIKDQSKFGLGDIIVEPFLSPRNPGKLIWAVGPLLYFPTATDDTLGAGKYAAGLATLLLTMPKNWVIKIYGYNLWSYAGDNNRADVNRFLVQPFLNYNFPKGWFLSTSSEITADWEADPDQRWTIPVGGGGGRVFLIGKQPVNLSAAAFYNLAHPDYCPDWQIRLQIVLLYPKNMKPKP